MSWYYAENNDRRGPVDEAAFGALLQAGTIRPETLVWRQGMSNWLPFSQSGYIPPVPGSVPASEPMETPRQPGVEMGVCSESGRILPRSELAEIDGKLVSAEYKHLVLQRIREGVSADGLAEDPEVIARRIEARGWEIRAGDCLGRAWALLKQNFWLCAGSTFLVYLVVVAAGMVPFGGLVVQGPLFGGLYWMFLKLLRGEPAAVGDAFQGFSRGWGHLVGVSLISTLLILPCFVPGAVVLAASTIGKSEPPVGGVILGCVLILIGMFVAIHFTVGWIFALALVADKRLEFWPAMKLSRRIVGMHWWQIFGLLFIAFLIVGGIMIVGMMLFFAVIGFAFSSDPGMAVGVGLLLGLILAFAFFSLLPLAFGAVMVAYEDIFGDRQSA